MLALVAGTAALGLELSAGLAAFAGAADVGLQLLLVVLGAAFAFRPELLGQDIHLGTPPSLGQLVLACALASVAFTGVESVGDLAAEARDPDRDLAPAAAGVLLSAVTLAAALSLVSLMAAPVPGVAHPAGPALGIGRAIPLRVLSAGINGVVGLLAAGLLALVAQGAVSRCGRLLAWQAQHRQLPAALAAVDSARGRRLPRSPRARSPPPGCSRPRARAAARGFWRRFTPSAPCSRSPAYTPRSSRFAGAIRAVTGAWPLRSTSRFAAGGFRSSRSWGPPAPPRAGSPSSCSTAACAFSGRCGFWPAWPDTPPTAAARASRWVSGRRAAPRPEAALGIEVEFQTMLIPVNTRASGIPADLLDVAAQLAAERRASLVVLAFTEIPLGEEMDLEIDGLDEAVERLAAAGRGVGDRYDIRVLTTQIPTARTRDPAESILAEADRRDSQVILLRAAGLQHADVRRVAYDHAVRRIVAEARQRVMIVRPEQAPA